MPLDLKGELEALLSDVRWNFVGILDTDQKLHPIPQNIQIQALLEYLAKERIIPAARQVWNCQVTEAESTREYPDLTLEAGPLAGRVVALDIKTTRRLSENLVSGFTLGSYGGYFRYPREKRPGCRIPYGQFTDHYIVGFIYDWREDADTLNMVSNLDLIVQEKWRIASRSSGTGTTTAIGSVKDIKRLKFGQGDFASEQDFLEYWRGYGAR